jgi:hypothetical protein
LHVVWLWLSRELCAGEPLLRIVVSAAHVGKAKAYQKPARWDYEGGGQGLARAASYLRKWASGSDGRGSGGGGGTGGGAGCVGGSNRGSLPSPSPPPPGSEPAACALLLVQCRRDAASLTDYYRRRGGGPGAGGTRDYGSSKRAVSNLAEVADWLKTKMQRRGGEGGSGGVSAEEGRGGEAPWRVELRADDGLSLRQQIQQYAGARTLVSGARPLVQWLVAGERPLVRGGAEARCAVEARGTVPSAALCNSQREHQRALQHAAAGQRVWPSCC